MTRSDARFSTYSGAPSIHPSLAATVETSSNRSSTQQYSSRFSEQTFLAPETIPEKNRQQQQQQQQRGVYGSGDGFGGAASSSLSLSSTDPKAAELRTFANTLDKMNDARMDKQRYVMSGNKTEEVSKNALGAKVERALSRRMVGQDATFRPKKHLDEKRALEVPAN